MSEHADKLVVLDEVQRTPELFATLRGLIDTGRRRGRKLGRFLLLGSASADRLRQSETRAGRIAYLELSPLDVNEVSRKHHTDLLLEMPGHGLWAIDIKRGLSALPAKGFHRACDDVKPVKRFVVNSGAERYAISKGVEAIGLAEMAAALLAL